jgi:hypothetical protein
MFLADETLKLTKCCHESQAWYHDNIYAVTPYNKCTIYLDRQVIKICDVQIRIYHQSICQNNSPYLAGLNDRFCRRPDTVEIGFGVCSINNESRIDVDPYANNILKAMASRRPRF